MGRSTALFLLASLLVGFFASASVARAESYEWQRTHRLLAHEGLELDPAPEGKQIAWVRIVRDDVFVEDEIWPTWFNIFHCRTRDEVIRRELLFEAGNALADVRLEESMRNLRGMGIFALVRIVAVRVQDNGKVGVVVHTRDLWSLRIEQDFNITTQINTLLVRLTERNLAGRQKSIGGDFLLVPKTYSLREFYYDRRVWGMPVSLSQSATVIFNREHGDAEGSVWSAALGKPYFNLKQRYDYAVSGSYSTSIARRLLNGDLDVYPAQGDVRAYRAWREESKSVGISGSIRRGERYKQTFGAGFSYRELDAFAIRETELPSALAEDFERDVLPRQRREIGPSVNYDIFIPTFHIFENLGTFGQSENVRVGPYTNLTVRAPLRMFGSSTNSWVLANGLGFVLAPAGGLVDAGIWSGTRYEESALVDQWTTSRLRGATPVFAKLRLVSSTTLELRRNDTTQTLVALGANNGLRGYPSQSIYGYGADKLLQNLEIRTLPIAWQAVHVGGVLFADVGSVFDRWREMQLHYAVGVGLRVFFPQFNRYPFSLDGGAGLDPPFRFTPTVTGGQIVPLTATEDALGN